MNAINFAKPITSFKRELSKISYVPANHYYSIKLKSGLKKSHLDFDITMGSFDGKEVCELVLLHLLDILRKVFGDNKLGL